MKPTLAGWLLAAPAVVAIAVFFVGPVAVALLMSATDFDLYGLAALRNVRFIGVDNYLHLLQTPLFWRALANTLFFVVVGVPLSIAVSLAAALLLHSRLARFKGFYRTALFTPVVTTLAAVAVVWIFLLHARYGLLNYGLSKLGLHPVDWLGDPHWAMPAIVMLSVWKNFGYNMIILLAGLQAIPLDLYEAAEVDGARSGAILRHITLPALGPMLVMVSVLTMAGHFQIFAEPYVMTQGGPAQRTVTVLYLMYEDGFKWWSLGSASSVAFVLFLFMLGFSLLQGRLARRSAPWS
jgi:multiple sugar transport system permease protein